MPKHTFKIRPAGSLEEAAENLINACGGPRRAAALPGCYVSASMLGKYMNADDPEDRNKTMASKLVAYFESHCGQPFVSAWTAAASDHVVVALPTADGIDLPQLVADMGKELGDVFQRAGAALADGKIDKAEAAALVDELHDVAKVAIAGITGLEEKTE
ncbi:MAG: hypothetical protein HQ512_04645 [Rhodospirillales bacterium]|nr:hypothetical protein [Rhodospirillales bacterium]